MTVVDTYKVLTGGKELTEDEYNRSAMLGWCTELVRIEQFSSGLFLLLTLLLVSSCKLSSSSRTTSWTRARLAAGSLAGI